jgi:hypothetical protein
MHPRSEPSAGVPYVRIWAGVPGDRHPYPACARHGTGPWKAKADRDVTEGSKFLGSLDDRNS